MDATPADLARAVAIARELDRRDARRKIDHLFPDETHEWRGQVYHARHLYPRHLRFFEAGATYRQRLLRAGNRVGKTVAGAVECSYHLTGQYPDWWPGRRFAKPARIWAAGKTNETTRDIVMAELLGGVEGPKGDKRVSGTGTIPGDLLGRPTWKAGVSDLVDTIPVKHVSGGWSTLGFKSYDQGRGSFEGTAREVIWFDEEPPADVYAEALIRTGTTNGLTIITFTPLAGMSDVVLSFEEEDVTKDTG